MRKLTFSLWRLPDALAFSEAFLLIQLGHLVQWLKVATSRFISNSSLDAMPRLTPIITVVRIAP